MKPTKITRKNSLSWQQSRLRRLVAVQKQGNATDRQLMRLRQLTVSVANLIKAQPKARK